jgi:ATP-dependent Clp protease ATP-binding subunit ClpA
VLTEAIRKKPFSLVLLDELEKANPDILNVFLQVMDDGRITDSVGRTVDCTNIILIATSNAGTAYIQSEITRGTATDKIKDALMRTELGKYYRPEFLNRFDGIVVFKPIEAGQMTRIAGLMLSGIVKKLDERGITLRFDDAAVADLAREGFDPQFGARPLRRVIENRVENKLAGLLLEKKIKRNGKYVFGLGDTVTEEL